MDSLRREFDAPILLVDAGDFSGGENAYGAALGRVMIDAMELMEYDAFTLGEWDFNQGPAYLRAIIEENPIAWVHTNYDVVGLEDLGQETLVVEKGGRRIGLLGLFNPTILLNPAMQDSVMVEEDVVASTKRRNRRARGAGRGRDRRPQPPLVQGRPHARAARPGIDVIVSGHGGKTLTAPEEVVPGTWLIASGSLGQFLGRAELAFGEGPEGEPVVAAVEGELIGMDPVAAERPAPRSAVRSLRRRAQIPAEERTRVHAGAGRERAHRPARGRRVDPPGESTELRRTERCHSSPRKCS